MILGSSFNVNLNSQKSIFDENQIPINLNEFDDTTIVIVTEPFIDSMRELIMTALNNLDAISEVKAIRIEF